GEAAASQRLDDPGRCLSRGACRERAPVERTEQGVEDAHRRRSLHRAGGEERHYLLSRALRRPRQGQGGSRLQISQEERRRVCDRQELTSTAIRDTASTRSRQMLNRAKEFSDGGAEGCPSLR